MRKTRTSFTDSFNPRISITLFVILNLLTATCRPSEENTNGQLSESTPALTNISFYSFRTTFDPSEKEIKYLNQIQPSEITFRLFDVDLEKKRESRFL